MDKVGVLGGCGPRMACAFDVVLFAILTFKFSFYGLSTFDSAGKDFSWLYFVLVCAESIVHGFYCSLAGCVLFTVW